MLLVRRKPLSINYTFHTAPFLPTKVILDIPTNQPTMESSGRSQYQKPPLELVFRSSKGLILTSICVAIFTDETGQLLGTTGIAMGLGLLLAPLLGGIVFSRAGYYAVFGMCFGLLTVDIMLRLVMIEKQVAAKWTKEDSHPEAPQQQKPEGINSTDEERAHGGNTESSSGGLDVVEESRFGEMEDVETTNMRTDTLAEDWSTRCAEIKIELNRLVMWKFDVTQRRLSPALNEESRLYSLLCESILGIGEIVKSLPSPHYIAFSADASLQLLYKKLEKTIERFKSQPNSTAMDNQPSANTRSRKQAIDSTDEGSLLVILRSEINVLSAIATVISTIDVVIRGMQELYMARERHQDVPKVMSAHCEELYNIKQILKVVQQEKVLRLGSIIEDLEQLYLHGNQLQRSLQKLGKERGQLQGIAHQLLYGQRSLDELNEIMGKVGRAKANISLKIQVVHVGLTRSLGDVVLVNCEVVEALDKKLQELLGEGNGLKIAELLQSHERHNGTVRLKDSDIASLTDNDSTVVDNQGNAPKNGTSLTVDNNLADDRALQLNAPIGTEGFLKVDHVTIINNRALKEAYQVNHAVSQANFDKILEARLGRR
ncbi:hypothetical protein diail_3184 [Diaporthe ilicicola]|nr:hypothetical protein diail_3184 [Diaporthe ilicicola]